MLTPDEKYMKAALAQAKKAYAIDEVPIGCVIVQNGKIIARGYNRRNTPSVTTGMILLSMVFRNTILSCRSDRMSLHHRY